MTLRSRNLLIGVMFLFLSACIGVLIFLFLEIDFANKNLVQVLFNGRGHYIHLSWLLSPQSPYINLISPTISIVFAWLVALVFLRLFRKGTSPQLFFLVMFWISMGVEIIRSLNLFALMHEGSIYQQIIFSRVIIIGRLFGAMSLFAASLYMVGMKMKHQGLILTFISVISISMANFIPIDTTRIGQELLFLPSEGYSLDIFRIVAGSLTVLNFTKYAFLSKDNGNYYLVLAILFLIVGHECQYIATNWTLVAFSWALLALGTGLMARRFINNYIWY